MRDWSNTTFLNPCTVQNMILSPLSSKRTIVPYPKRGRIVLQKSSSFCDNQISSEVIETNHKKISVVIVILASRSTLPLRLVGMTTKWRRNVYVRATVSTGTVTSLNYWRQKKSASTWVLSSHFLNWTSRSCLLRCIPQRMSVQFGLEISKKHRNDAW